jgi:glucose-1-phosphate thymidylyltransferase
MDTVHIENLFETSQFIANIEKRQGLKIACLEEIALKNKWITKSKITKQINFYGNCDYSKYLKKLL